MFSKPMLKSLLFWILERESIRQKKEAGQPRPWTKDSILNVYRFCNVYREFDRVTLWIAENWRNPNRKNKDLWFAMVVARLLNQPPTLANLGFPVPWNPDHFVKKLKALRQRGTIFNSAYIVSTNGKAMDKVDYLAQYVLNPLWTNRKELQPQKGQTLDEYHQLLTQYDGLGSFMAAQVIADMKYVPPLDNAEDWYTFAASGPGSRRGLNRMLGRDKDSNWREDEWRSYLEELRTIVNNSLNRKIKEDLHGQDMQNCLCEFDKYQRAITNDGRPKQLYKPRS
jgi:hypothetical protein